MSTGKLTVNVKVKVVWWYNALSTLLLFLGNFKCINPDMAISILCKTASRGYKYKIGNGKREKLDRKIEYKTP